MQNSISDSILSIEHPLKQLNGGTKQSLTTWPQNGWKIQKHSTQNSRQTLTGMRATCCQEVKASNGRSSTNQMPKKEENTVNKSIEYVHSAYELLNSPYWISHITV